MRQKKIPLVILALGLMSDSNTTVTPPIPGTGVPDQPIVVPGTVVSAPTDANGKTVVVISAAQAERNILKVKLADSLNEWSSLQKRLGDLKAMIQTDVFKYSDDKFQECINLSRAQANLLAELNKVQSDYATQADRLSFTNVIDDAAKINAERNRQASQALREMINQYNLDIIDSQNSIIKLDGTMQYGIRALKSIRALVERDKAGQTLNKLRADVQTLTKRLEAAQNAPANAKGKQESIVRILDQMANAYLFSPEIGYTTSALEQTLSMAKKQLASVNKIYDDYSKQNQDFKELISKNADQDKQMDLIADAGSRLSTITKLPIDNAFEHSVNPKVYISVIADLGPEKLDESNKKDYGYIDKKFEDLNEDVKQWRDKVSKLYEAVQKYEKNIPEKPASNWWNSLFGSTDPDKEIRDFQIPAVASLQAVIIQAQKDYDTQKKLVNTFDAKAKATRDFNNKLDREYIKSIGRSKEDLERTLTRQGGDLAVAQNTLARTESEYDQTKRQAVQTLQRYLSTLKGFTSNADAKLKEMATLRDQAQKALDTFESNLTDLKSSKLPDGNLAPKLDTNKKDFQSNIKAIREALNRFTKGFEPDKFSSRSAGKDSSDEMDMSSDIDIS